MKKQTPRRSLVVFSDTHSGCRLSVYPKDCLIRLDDGGSYRPSEFQEQLWALWREMWDEWIPLVTRGEPYDLLHNGDAIEGVHHQSVTQISHNLKDQMRMALALLEPVVAKCRKMGGTYYHVRGTEAHVGKSGSLEESLAQSLGAKPNASGQYARWRILKQVGDKDGPLVHALHHIGTTGSAAHEASAVNAEYTAVMTEAARRGVRPPDFVVRSHRHRYIGVDKPSARGNGGAIVSPGWQGLTPFTYKIPGARVSEPEFGGLCIRQGDEENYFRKWVRSFEPEKPE